MRIWGLACLLWIKVRLRGPANFLPGDSTLPWFGDAYNSVTVDANDVAGGDMEIALLGPNHPLVEPFLANGPWQTTISTYEINVDSGFFGSGTVDLEFIVDEPAVPQDDPMNLGVFTNPGTTPGSSWTQLPTTRTVVGTVNGDQVWGLIVNDLDHNSIYAVVMIPEPSAILVLSGLAACVFGIGRRRRGQ